MNRMMWSWIVLAAAGCTDTDEGGCPLELAEAVGEDCRDEGLACGEVSLCDPCTSDLSRCEQIECRGGTWVAIAPETECPEG